MFRLPRTCVIPGCAAFLAVVAGPSADGRDRVERAPPPPVFDVGSGGPSPTFRAATTQYSHGDPSDEEQLYLELMNRARTDPVAEAARIFRDYDSQRVTNAVDFFQGRTDGIREFTRAENRDAFLGYTPQPPFAMNGAMLTAARNWSATMRRKNRQEHNFDGEPGLRERIEGAGYAVNAALGENVFAFARSMLHAHAGFTIDWGQPDVNPQDGVQDLGHRKNIMNLGGGRDYREVGIGLVKVPAPDPFSSDVGPQLLTVDFAVTPDNSVRFVTGVCFVDADGDNFYDKGEGVAGVRVETDKSDFFAVSSASGGYAFPVPRTAGVLQVTATGLQGTDSEIFGTRTIAASTFDFDAGGGNTKVDFMPPPDPPLPAVTQIAGAVGAVPDGTAAAFTAAVGQLDPESANLGDLDVKVDVSHADRSELRVTLRNPSGTELVLWDGAVAGVDLVGSFDSDLDPVDDLAAFVGQGYQGTWTLTVTDAGGGATATVNSWSLCVRPAWVRGLHAARTNLFVTKVKFKDKDNPLADAVVLKAEFNPGRLLAPAENFGVLRVTRTDGGRQELFSVDIPGPSAAAKLDGAAVTAKLERNRKDSSRTRLKLKVKLLDLPGLPPNVGLELYLGNGFARIDVPLANGSYTGKRTPADEPVFVVTKMKSKDLGNGVRSTVVKGILRPGPVAATFAGFAEIRVGTFTARRETVAFTTVGNKHTFKSGGPLVKLVVDFAKGKWAAKIVGAHEAVVDGVTEISLRAGDYYGASRVVPRVIEGKAAY